MAASTYSPSQSSDSKKRRRQRRLFQEADWARSDGQTFHRCRTAFLRTGAANAASGYAYAEFGTTKLIISVFGPSESKKAMLYSNTGREQITNSTLQCF